MATGALEKKMRSHSLSNFTRNANKLEQLMNKFSSLAVVTPQFEKLMKCWDKLEEAHEEFISKSDIEDIVNDPDRSKYLDVPELRHKDLME